MRNYKGCCTDRIPRPDNLFLREKPVHFVIIHAYPVRFLGQHPIGNARQGVLFLQQGGNMQFLGRIQSRSTGIPSYADHHIGIELLNQIPSPPQAGRQLERQADILPPLLAVQAYHIQTYDPVTGRRHFFHFHPVFRTHEQYFRIFLATSYFVGNGNSRENMPAGSAPTDNHSYRGSRTRISNTSSSICQSLFIPVFIFVPQQVRSCQEACFLPAPKHLHSE